jgi:hypothetical protein
MTTLRALILSWALIAAAVFVGQFIPALGLAAIFLWLSGISIQAFLSTGLMTGGVSPPGQTTGA